MSKKKNKITMSLPNWWQTLIILVILITVVRLDPNAAAEMISEIYNAWKAE